MIKHDPTSAAGGGIDITLSNFGGIFGSFIMNTDLSVRSQGVELNDNYNFILSDNVLDGFGIGYHLQGGSYIMGGVKANDMDGGIWGMEEVYPLIITSYPYRNSDSIVLSDVTNFLTEATAAHSGRYLYCPFVKFGGSFTFSPTYANHTDNETDRSFINVGAGIAHSIRDQLTGALTDGAPTDAELDSVTGLTPATAGAGWSATIRDTDGSVLLYRVESNGTNWQYQVLAIAL